MALQNRKRAIDSGSCKLDAEVAFNASAQRIEALFLCPLGLRVHWSLSVGAVHVPTENFLEEGSVAGAAARVHAALSGPLKAAPRPTHW